MSKVTKLNVEYFSDSLKDKLEEISNFPCTLIEAASGFGKTTAVNFFLSKKVEEGCRVLTYRFLPENSMETSWFELSEVLGELGSADITKIRSVGIPGEDSLPDIRRIIHDYKGDARETYLFMDDYQEWKCDYAVEIIGILSTHQADNLHIIIASHPFNGDQRTKLIPSNRMYQLNEYDLVFSRDDIRAYYKKAGINATESQIDEVMELTGGWIMAIYLQLGTFVKRGGFIHAGLSVLMKKAVWNNLESEQKETLLKLSVLPSFNLKQAATISGKPKSVLEKSFREKRYFIQYSPQEGRYYLHTQLKLFLNSQFELLSDDEKKEVYHTAGQISWEAGDHKRAIRFLYLSGQWDKIYELPLDIHDFASVNEDYVVPMIVDIMEHSDRELMYKYPMVPICMMFVVFMMGENDIVMRFSPMLRENIAKSDLSDKEKDVLQGEMELMLSFLLFNKLDAITVHHKRAWKLMKGPSKLFNPRCSWAFGSPSVLYLYWRESGKLSEELTQLDDCMAVYTKLSGNNGIGGDIIMRAEADLNSGNYEKAEIGAYKALFEAESNGQTAVEVCGALVLARVALLTGKEELFKEAETRLKLLSSIDIEDLSRYTYDMADGFIGSICDDYGRIRPWLCDGKIDAGHLTAITMPFAYIIYGRYLLEKKDYTRLLGASNRAMSLSSVFPNLLPMLYTRIYCAAAHEALGNTKESMLELKTALEMGLPDKVYLPFAENYHSIKKIMARFKMEQQDRDMIEKMAKDLEAGLETISVGGPRLTDREKEVLELIKQGLTNGEIAKEQMVSLSTVKKQVSSILLKFGLASREQLKNY
ncbi:helix-turn-helix transcriptional regulator [Butyrivibrio sp. CB08]|uniref:LuxR C-terminal-related transcriptional regulator n=1 Tax=Butyrivibrio sp. CB08 TaxID=2364879 RepID=UPI000EA9CA02|nr:LuxR C-terminal-related transcriptional regulator [Butyrivibrio sp. CB08]RKM60597.1 helix-turn-helix transcriptional regulator [Butyrivibrio sp. CB08]